MANKLDEKHYRKTAVSFLNSMISNKNDITLYIGASKAYKGLKEI